MNPFRRNVLVLFGAALLVALSVSSVLGAKPTGSDSGPRGQTISAFVHALIAGDQEVTVDENPTDEAPADEETSNEEDSTPADEDTSDSSSEANAHGKCVSEIAQNPDEVGGDNDNHGGAVSLAARETCRDEAADTAAADDVQAEMTAREEAAAARAAAKEARMADKAEKAAARDARKAEQAAAVHGKSGTHGGGHGH
jgi:type IV secretory pathway VirB10-like protein